VQQANRLLAAIAVPPHAVAPAARPAGARAVHATDRPASHRRLAAGQAGPLAVRGAARRAHRVAAPVAVVQRPKGHGIVA